MIVELITIGNELLTGKTVNTNASWIADRVTRLGGLVKRVTVVSDDIDEIASALKEALSRKTELIITTGGLGPTYDDRTMEGVVKALGLKLELSEEAFNMLKSKVGDRALVPHVKKMAYVPQGSKALLNPVGTASGALVMVNGVKIVILPGVPAEMKAMFEAYVEPILKEGAREVLYDVEATVVNVYEADLSPLIDELLKLNLKLYIKSSPRLEEGRSILKVYIAYRSQSIDEAREGVEEALRKLKERVKSKFTQALFQV